MAEESPILHLVVVGFHHKKGYQVDYSYPALELSKDDNECPAGWKYLPTLALPDGSHNFAQDTVFFSLPSLRDSRGTVFGISCYRQIAVENLKILTADMTRSTVQKAVCAIATVPLYGYIEVKLSLIAQAFFDQGDFSNTAIIRKAYDNLNACLTENLFSLTPVKQTFVGLSTRDIVLRWRHKILILFKLVLLQRRVIFFGSPVRPICSLILGILSLHPEQLERGLDESACMKISRSMSPVSDADDIDEDFEANPDELICQSTIPCDRKVSVSEADSSALNGKQAQSNLSKAMSVDTLASSLLPYCAVGAKSYGAPLPLFTEGMLCLPYLSLPYMDLLNDPTVNGFIIGTSNILFRQKRQIRDVLIDVESASIETQDPELRRQLSLTTEDLRFVDYIVRNVQYPKEDAEGSEQWIRQQFHGYMLAILRTAVTASATSKDVEHFNAHFVGAWKRSNGYQKWLGTAKAIDFDFEPLPVGHPFAGTLSMGDMKLKISHTMNSSESGRKVNQAVSSTSKAVGGAISQAKGAFSNIWSAFTAPMATVTPPTPTLGQPALSDDFVTDIFKSHETDGNSDEDDVITIIDGDKTACDDRCILDQDIRSAVGQTAIRCVANSLVEIGREAENFNTKPGMGRIEDV